MARSAVKWIIRQGINVLTMSPGKKDYGHHNYPLERIEKAITWLRAHGNRKIAIAGASTTGTLALTAAAMFPEITLTIAMTPSDFVWQGFMQGKKDGCKEWPIEGESLFAYHGKPLPYMPFCYQHPDYWNCIAAETKRTFRSRTFKKGSCSLEQRTMCCGIPASTSAVWKPALQSGRIPAGRKQWSIPTEPTLFSRKEC